MILRPHGVLKKRHPDWLASALFGYQRDEVHLLGYHAILRLSFLEPCFVLAPAGSPPVIRRPGILAGLLASTTPLERSRIKHNGLSYIFGNSCLTIYPIILTNYCLCGYVVRRATGLVLILIHHSIILRTRKHIGVEKLS